MRRGRLNLKACCGAKILIKFVRYSFSKPGKNPSVIISDDRIDSTAHRHFLK